MFGDFVDLTYTMEPQIKDTNRYAGNLDLRLEIDNADGQERNSKDRKNDFNFPIVNFPFINNNMLAIPKWNI
jgi:hypothetical protein